MHGVDAGQPGEFAQVISATKDDAFGTVGKEFATLKFNGGFDTAVILKLTLNDLGYFFAQRVHAGAL